jgi:hypothetical protein
LNAEYAPKWPVINATKEPLPTAEEFREVEDKRAEMVLEPGEGT